MFAAGLLQGTAQDTAATKAEREARWEYLTEHMRAEGVEHLSKKRLQNIQEQYARSCSHLPGLSLFTSAATECEWQPCSGTLVHMLTLANMGNTTRLQSMKQYWTELDLSSLEQMQQQPQQQQPEEENDQQQQWQDEDEQQQADQQQQGPDAQQEDPQQGGEQTAQQQQQQAGGDPRTMFDLESRGPPEEGQKRRRQDTDGNQQKRQKGNSDDGDDDSDMSDAVRVAVAVASSDSITATVAIFC